MAVTLLLYRPENPENLGSIARAAANFDFSDIILIEPQCEINERSRQLAKHGKAVLEAMRIADRSVLGQFDVVIATHGRTSTAYNLVRAPITPRQLGQRLAEIDDCARIGILFGPEGEGLDKELLAHADIIIAIPTSRDYPSMNLAQSVTIILYELSLLRGEENKITLPYRPMARQEHDALLRLVDQTLETLPFKTESQKETQRLLWRRMIGRSFLTKRECAVLMGFLKSVSHRAHSADENA